jgi:flagellar motility protein MotE (MotC chaperone)
VRLLQRIKHDVRAGWASLRYGTAKAATRALEEAELLRLRLDLRKLDERIRDLCGDIGERAVELHERGESSEHVLADREINRIVQQVSMLRAERSKLLSEMDDVRSGE